MDIVEKLNRLLMDTTAHAEDSADISQGPYGSNILGMRYRKKKCKVRGGAEYSMHEDKNFKVTVIVKEKKYRKTFNIKAPREGLARTRAINKAIEGGLKLAGALVEYEVNEALSNQRVKPTLQNQMSKTKDIDELRDFIDKQRTWFQFDDIGDDYILLATRDNGDVGAERPGQVDQKEAIRLGRAIKQRFKTVKIDLDTVDEWVHLEIRL